MQGASLTRSWAARARCGSLRAFRRALESGTLPRWNPPAVEPFIFSWIVQPTKMEQQVVQGGVWRCQETSKIQFPRHQNRGLEVSWDVKRRPRRSQDARDFSKTSQDASKTPSHAPKTPQEASKVRCLWFFGPKIEII